MCNAWNYPINELPILAYFWYGSLGCCDTYPTKESQIESRYPDAIAIFKCLAAEGTIEERMIARENKILFMPNIEMRPTMVWREPNTI